jgi:hypothetical protein
MKLFLHAIRYTRFCPQYAVRSTVYAVRKNNLFMQNKANFRKVKLNVTKVLTKDYDRIDTWSIGKNEPKTNPNEPKTNPIKANKMPKQTQYKAKQTQFQRQIPSVRQGRIVKVPLAATIIFSQFRVLVLTSVSKSRILPLLYFPVVLNRLFEGIR